MAGIYNDFPSIEAPPRIFQKELGVGVEKNIKAHNEKVDQEYQLSRVVALMKFFAGFPAGVIMRD